MENENTSYRLEENVQTTYPTENLRPERAKSNSKKLNHPVLKTDKRLEQTLHQR